MNELFSFGAFFEPIFGYNSMMKKHSASSHRWLTEHFNDPYVKQAQKLGYRSRAAFKLLEINQRNRVLYPGRIVVDLGAAPGGWSQIAVKEVGAQGRVIASDILEMEPLPGVEFIHGDFREDEVLQTLLDCIGTAGAGLVISDMAPNISGIDAVDQPQGMYLVELAIDLAQKVLILEGDLLIKVFQGEGFDGLIQSLRKAYRKVLIRKPKASRPRSREVYVVALGLLKV